MRPIATDVARSVVSVSVCLCVGHTGELCKNSWSDRDAVRGLTIVDLNNHVLNGGQHRTNPFAAARVTRRRCGLLPNYFLELRKGTEEQRPPFDTSYHCSPTHQTQWKSMKRDCYFDSFKHKHSGSFIAKHSQQWLACCWYLAVNS